VASRRDQEWGRLRRKALVLDNCGYGQAYGRAIEYMAIGIGLEEACSGYRSVGLPDQVEYRARLVGTVT